jgi:tetratricopeptide (TPR) repeat protein
MEEPAMIEPEDLLARGAAASQAGDSETAIRLFDEATRVPSLCAMAHFLLACEYAALEHTEAAEAAFAAAVLKAPGMAVARYQLGLLQFSTGRVAMALLTWEPLHALADDHPLQRFARGFAALADEALAEAIALFLEGIALNRDNEPLNGDIRKVLDQVQRAAPGRPPPGEAAGTEPADGSHVLLGNYRRQGPLH